MDGINKSLDEIISTSRTKSNRRQPRRSANGGTPATTRQRYAGAVPAANGNRAVGPSTTPAPTGSATKIIVSNLPTDVNEPQVKELFSTTVGPLREVNLHFDARGHSKGVAVVIFSHKGDANKAFTQYNGRLIDGKKPMKIEIVLDPSRPAPPPTLSQRVAPAPVAAPMAVDGPAKANGQSRGGRPSGGARGRGRRPRGKKDDRPSKSVADLDAEMEDYTAQPAAPAVAAA